MFPGYILVETDEIINFYYRAKRWPHIIRFLKSNEQFFEIGLEEIWNVIYMVNDEGIIGISKAFIVGETIQVTEGPLTGKEGIIRKLDKRKGRAKVEFTISYQKYLIDLGIDILGKYERIEDLDEFTDDPYQNFLNRNNKF